LKKFKPILIALATASALLAQPSLTPKEQRGQQIYERGTTASGRPVTASMGAGNSGIPGSILPCANCHRHDGRGERESGTVSSNITWDALTKPYGVTHASGRTHPPYTERLLKRAITLGIDPAGNSLDNAMPRFQLFNEDFSDLVTYIKRLGQSIDLGLTSNTIRLGVILPPSVRHANMNRLVREALLSYFGRVNAMGGIFSRRAELSFTELPANPVGVSTALRDFINKEQVFALVAGFLKGAEAEVGDVLRETRTPSVGAFVDAPHIGSAVNPYAFCLDGGWKDEVDALAQFAVREFSDKKVRVAIAEDEDSHRIAQSLRDRLKRAGFEYVAGNAADADVIFWLLSESALPSAMANSRTRIFSVATNGVSPVSEDRRAWELRAVAAAEIAVEGLRRAGRDVSREALVVALEGVYRFETSAGPVSFGPNRHTGITGADVLVLDQKTHRFIRVSQTAPRYFTATRSAFPCGRCNRTARQQPT
jgi:ABC-type branched-subunit amino acid transport system substrate-binding protein